MHRTVLIIFFLILMQSAWTQTPAKATIKFDEEMFDFGSVVISLKTAHEFYFTNTGKKPIKLKKVTTSCGCTKPQWDSLPVLPGKRGKIIVFFECFPLEKSFDKTISIESNAEPNIQVLEIKGRCVDPYKTQKSRNTLPIGRILFGQTHVNFDKIHNNVSLKQKEISFFNNSDDTIKVDEFQTPAYLVCAASPSIILPHQEGVIYLNYNATLVNEFGFKLEKFKIITDDKDFPIKWLTVSAEILEYFDTTHQNNATIFLKESSFEFGKIKVGDIKTHTFEIKNTGTDTLFIHHVKSSCGCTEAILGNDKIAPGKTVQLKVIFNTAGVTKGINNKRITLISTDRKNPVIYLGISVVVD